MYIFIYVINGVNPSPDDNILSLSKLKAFADDNLNATKNIKVVFQKACSSMRQKSSLCGKGLKKVTKDVLPTGTRRKVRILLLIRSKV